jgi:hypothetical protein
MPRIGRVLIAQGAMRRTCRLPHLRPQHAGQPQGLDGRGQLDPRALKVQPNFRFGVESGHSLCLFENDDFAPRS